ncbi:MAG: hypothetical protein O7C75_10130 [Verrucomicrobia bacterium]|nr:hypothetical protein [Verrucomicrobiota bacterium]
MVLVGCGPVMDTASVHLVEGSDLSAGDLLCYIISTPTATYYLEKEGGGLSSMLDVDGIDWLGFHKKKGSESKGEYRGFPNAIYKEDGSFFHAKNVATDVSTSVLKIDSANHVRIVFTSGNGKWVGRWDFYPDRCSFTMDKISEGYKYWILYEGVPGGQLDKTDFWYSSKDEAPHSIDEKQKDDLPGPEWIAFGDEKSPRMIYISHHEDDLYPDRYYNMRDEMTVFGFGRDGGAKFLDTPQSFSIGFVEATDYELVAQYVGSLNN